MGVHKGDQERFLGWSRGRQALNKNGENRGWIRLHTKLRVDAYKNWRRRSNKNGETCKGGGAWHWLQSSRTVTCSCERSTTSPSSRACEEDRKSSPARSTSSRLAAEWRLQPLQQQFEGDGSAVELFELCETIPKVQCSHCLLYWNQGIVYCTCGQFLIDSESWRKFHKLRLDALSLSRTT